MITWALFFNSGVLNLLIGVILLVSAKLLRIHGYLEGLTFLDYVGAINITVGIIAAAAEFIG